MIGDEGTLRPDIVSLKGVFSRGWDASKSSTRHP
jgi:hypothetical protein